MHRMDDDSSTDAEETSSHVDATAEARSWSLHAASRRNGITARVGARARPDDGEANIAALHRRYAA